MSSPPQFQNETERRFASYLESRSLGWAYEALVGDKRPDFSVRWHGGRVICEAHEPAFRLRNRSGAFDPYVALRRSMRKKRGQGAGAQAQGLPYVLIVSDVGADVVFDEHNVPGAMFGDLSISMRVSLGPEPATRQDASSLVAGLNGQLQALINTRFSAVCVVREFNPTTAAVERMLPAVDLPAQLTEERVMERMAAGFAAFDQARAEGRYDPEASAVRLLVFHNPYAAVPLPPDLFAGPHDQIFGLLNDAGGYGLAAEGTQSMEVPGR